MADLPRSPLYAFFLLPRGLLLKVHAEPCMYAPGYLQSNKPRWPGAMTESLRACRVTYGVLASRGETVCGHTPTQP